MLFRSFLTKGFAIVAICGLVFLFYCFFNRKLNSFFSAILNIKAWTIFIIIVSPWLVYLYMQTSSEAVMYMLFGQSFGRFSNAFENHSGSIFYYLVVLPFITLALINLHKFEEQKKNKYLNLAAAWIALGFLTKGFAIVAICGLVFLF